MNEGLSVEDPDKGDCTSDPGVLGDFNDKSREERKEVIEPKDEIEVEDKDEEGENTLDSIGACDDDDDGEEEGDDTDEIGDGVGDGVGGDVGGGGGGGGDVSSNTRN